jgi:type IV fimbrial biogenesis protein FimT
MRPAEIRRASGFTIVELMLTVTVATILVALALPSFKELTISNNITEMSNQLMYSLNVARSEAVRRGTFVKVVNSTASGVKWSGGWSVLADNGFDGTFSTTTLIASQGSIPATYSVCSSSSGGGNAWAAVFNSQGTLVGANTFDFNVNRPDSNNVKSSRVTVQPSGAAHSQLNTTGSPAPFSC